MKPNRWYPLGFALFISLFELAGATSLTNMNGEVFVFGEWSLPKFLTVMSTQGDVRLVQLTCEMSEARPFQPKMRMIEVVYDPRTRELLVGEPAQHYVMLQQKIWGISASGRLLRIKRSEAAGDILNGEELVKERFLAKLIEEPHTSLWMGDAAINKIDLLRIFGSGAIYSDRSARLSRNGVRISAIAVDSTGIVLTLMPTGGHTLLLKVDEDLEILAAQKNGIPIPVLFNGRIPSNEPHGFTSLGQCELVNQAGKLMALVSHRDYTMTNDAGEERPLAGVNAVVLPTTSDLWIGPDDCRLAVVQDRILGVKVSRSSDLFVIAGPRAHIPSPPKGIDVFRQEVLKFSNEFEANRYQWKPDFNVNIRDVFPGDSRFPRDSTFWLGPDGLSVRDSSLVVRIRSSNARAYCEIILGPSLNLLSARVVELNAFGRLDWGDR